MFRAFIGNYKNKQPDKVNNHTDIYTTFLDVFD